MKYLLPGDVILADMGFDIGDSDAHFGATVEIPAFTKEKKNSLAHSMLKGVINKLQFVFTWYKHDHN